MNKIDITLLAPLKNLLATKTRRLFENFLSLPFLQVANFIFPIIILKVNVAF